MPLEMFKTRSGLEIIGVAAGKGGVGKSTVTAHLAKALTTLGQRVGVIDADVYGPSMHKLLPSSGPGREEDWLVPADSAGIKLMSVAFFRKEGAAAVVRAPIANDIITQFTHKTLWGELDILLIDFPPGTGDVQLTLMQQAKLSGAVLVTTPQEIALMDVRKAHECFERMHVPTLGVVENMSYLKAGGEKIFPMGEGGGERLAHELRVPLLAQIPLEPAISLMGDQGQTVLDGEAALQFYSLAKKLGARSASGAAIEKIFQNGPKEIVIEWTDGASSRYDLCELQRLCPCARCLEKRPEGAEGASGFERVGRYALKFEFTRGCKSGIYPLELLRRIKGLKL